MKKSIIIVFVSLLHGCGSDISEQIEGVKWADNFSKLGTSQAYTRFINGKIMSCVKDEGKWKAVTSYEIKGNKLTIPADDKSKEERVFEIKIKGSGEEKVLIMTKRSGEKSHEMIFPVSTTTDCPITQ
jgi:hypothetical protein